MKAVQSNNQVKLLNVQVLRAYGALAVAFYHTGFSFGIGKPIGSFGVGIFFVISGFMMAYICATSPRRFLSRRMARIVPLYWLLTLGVYLVAVISPRLLEATNNNPVQLLKSLFFIPFLKHGDFYPVLFLGWSLNFEMYFYFLIAGALFLSKRHACFIASVAMSSVLIVIRSFRSTGTLSFYARPVVLLFVCGVICFHVFQWLSTDWIRSHRIYLMVGCLLSGITMVVAAIMTTDPVRGGVVGVTSTFLVLGAVLLDKVGFSLRSPFLVFLGDASYVIYLVHPYAQEAMNKLLARSSPILRTETLVGMPVSLFLTVLISAVLFRYIDNPLHLYFRNLFSERPKQRAEAASNAG